MFIADNFLNSAVDSLNIGIKTFIVMMTPIDLVNSCNYLLFICDGECLHTLGFTTKFVF